MWSNVESNAVDLLHSPEASEPTHNLLHWIVYSHADHELPPGSEACNRTSVCIRLQVAQQAQHQSGVRPKLTHDNSLATQCSSFSRSCRIACLLRIHTCMAPKHPDVPVPHRLSALKPWLLDAQVTASAAYAGGAAQPATSDVHHMRWIFAWRSRFLHR
jgi:hypothetical protein